MRQISMWPRKAACGSAVTHDDFSQCGISSSAAWQQHGVAAVWQRCGSAVVYEGRHFGRWPPPCSPSTALRRTASSAHHGRCMGGAWAPTTHQVHGRAVPCTMHPTPTACALRHAKQPPRTRCMGVLPMGHVMKWSLGCVFLISMSAPCCSSTCKVCARAREHVCACEHEGASASRVHVRTAAPHAPRTSPCASVCVPLGLFHTLLSAAPAPPPATCSMRRPAGPKIPGSSACPRSWSCDTQDDTQDCCAGRSG